jgi:glycine/D-amino acid oxidase-like deaminating enzyme
VAAGIFNPITGRRWVTTWRAKEIFDHFPAFYKSLEKETGAKFFYPKPVYRSFQNLTEQNDWLNKPENEKSEFVLNSAGTSRYGNIIRDELGGLLLDKSGYLDVAHFLNVMREKFLRLNILREEEVNLKTVEWSSPFTINGATCVRLILCMGFQGTQLTPFRELPFNAVKGELLEVEIKAAMPEVIFNGPVFILPQPNGISKIGATYDFDDKSPVTTATARKLLIEKTDSYLLPGYTIIRQTAGIRPSSVDRRPVVGEHPAIPNLGILNGLGTKGVSLAPYISELLLSYFENGKELDREIDIKRFFD